MKPLYRRSNINNNRCNNTLIKCQLKVPFYQAAMPYFAFITYYIMLSRSFLESMENFCCMKKKYKNKFRKLRMFEFVILHFYTNFENDKLKIK